MTISMDEYESIKDTIEIFSSPRAMGKIMCGEQELLAGKGRKIEDVKKELGF